MKLPGLFGRLKFWGKKEPPKKVTGPIATSGKPPNKVKPRLKPLTPEAEAILEEIRLLDSVEALFPKIQKLDSNARTGLVQRLRKGENKAYELLIQQESEERLIRDGHATREEIEERRRFRVQKANAMRTLDAAGLEILKGIKQVGVFTDELYEQSRALRPEHVSIILRTLTEPQKFSYVSAMNRYLERRKNQ